MSATEEFEKVRAGLLERGLKCPVTTENYIFRLARNFVPNVIKPDELPYLNSIYLLRAADFCVTRNMCRPITKSTFRPAVLITQDDVEIVSSSSVGTCFGDPWTCVVRNHIVYVATLSGEAFRLNRLVNGWKATDLLKEYDKHEGLADDLIKQAGSISPCFADFLRIKAYIWFETARVIGLSKKLQELELE